MADKLIFPIGFDLEAGVKEAGENWEKAAEALEAKIGKRPIKVNVTFSTKSLEDLETRLSKIKLAPIDDATRDNIRTLTAEMKGLAKALEAVQKVSSARAGATPDAVRAARIAEVAKRTDDKHNESLLRQRRLIAQAEAAEARRRKTIEGTTREYHSQTSYLERMAQRLAIYYSIGQVASFLTKVREVTAQFELQRVALGAIIQDQPRANALFSEIKQFALKSPVSVMDLTKYTKQVAAYRIETDKLFDTTKRLADVSVGLGVDMGRLVLAYGQVKAASYLRAAEIRQFTEAGIPMLELLAEKFTKLNGEAVTTEKVMDMVSKRMVSFEIVEQVFEDMTSAGGMFYNMQEKQGNTLFGMWAKLGDAASMMYDEIGNTESVNSGMKSLIETLSGLMRSWQSTTRELAMLGTAFVGYKLYVKAAKIYTDYLTTAQKLNTAAQRAMYLETIKQSGATRGFYGIVSKLPISMSSAAAATRVFALALRAIKSALITTGIGALVVAITYLIEKLFFAESAADKVKEALNDIGKETYTQQRQSTRNFEYLAKSALDTSKSYKEQQDALAELQRTYKDILPLEVMEIDYLKSLNGDYSSLTDTISRYIAVRQKQKALDTIEEKYGAELREYQLNLSEKMKKWGWSEEEIGRFFGAFQNEAKDASKNFLQMIKDALDFADKSGAENVERLLPTRYIEGKNHNIKEITVADADATSYIKTIQKMLEAEKGVAAEYDALSEGADRFSKALKNINKQMENYQPTALVGGEEKGVDANVFVGKQAQINKKVQELESVLFQEFQRGGKKITALWNSAFINMIDIVDANKPELISSIDFAGIIKTLSAKLNDPGITDSQREYITGLLNTVRKAQMAYNQFVPSDNTMIVWNARMRQLADGVGVVEKKYTQYLMKSGEGLKDWNKRIKDSVKELKDSIKSIIATKAELNAIGYLANPKLVEQTEAELKDQQQRLELLEKLLALMPSFDKGKTGRDTRVQQEKEYLSVLEKVYSKFKELQKSMSKVDAWRFMEKYYADSISYLNKHGLGLARDAEEYKKYVSVIRTNMQKLAGDKNPTVRNAAKKEVAEINVKLGDVDFGEMKDSIEKKLKKLSEDIAQSKIAKEFFDKMLSETGDVELATSITVSIYGDTGKDLFHETLEQIETAFSGANQIIPWFEAVDYKNEVINYKKLAEVYEKYKGDILESNLDLIKTIIKNGQSASAEQIKTWQKELAKAKDYEQKRTDIIKTESARRAEIIKSSLPQEEKDALLKQSREKQSLDLSALGFQEFKASEDYVKIFEDLSDASTKGLIRLRKEMQSIIDTDKDLSPQNMKELVKAMGQIDDEIQGRGFGYGIVESVREYMAAATALKTAKQELATARKTYEEQEPGLNADIQAKTEAKLAAERELETLKNSNLATDEQIKAAELAVEDAATEVVLAEQAKAKAAKEVQKAEANVTNQQDKQRKSSKKFVKDLSTAQSTSDKLASVLGDVKDLLGISSDTVAGLVFDSAVEGLERMSKIYGVLITMQELFNIVTESNPWMAIAAAVLATVSILGSAITGANTKKQEKTIKNQEKVLKQLERAYEKLKDQMDETFGAEYIQNYNDRLNNLEQQAEAKLKQYNAEKDKGKKKDKEKMQDYWDEYQEILEEIQKIKATDLQEKFMGTDLGSAAVDFANAWLDAYISFGNTADAIEEKFNDLIRNMIVQNLIAGAIQSALGPIFDKVKDYAADGELTEQEMADIINDSVSATTSIDTMLTSLVEGLKKAGIDVRSLGDAADDATGIKRDLATASEESINGLAAGINTQNFYIAQIHANVAVIAKRMQGGEVTDTSGGNESLTLQHLAYLPTIAQNTAETVVRCERAASACERMAEQIGRVIRPRGVESQYVVNVS